MKAKVKTMETELQNCGKLPIFEIEVINRHTRETDYIVCDIFFRGNSLVAQRQAVTAKEERSRKIANNTRVVDTDMTLDQNLEALYEDIIQSIIDSDFYELTDN